MSHPPELFDSDIFAYNLDTLRPETTFGVAIGISILFFYLMHLRFVKCSLPILCLIACILLIPFYCVGGFWLSFIAQGVRSSIRHTTYKLGAMIGGGCLVLVSMVIGIMIFIGCGIPDKKFIIRKMCDVGDTTFPGNIALTIFLLLVANSVAVFCGIGIGIGIHAALIYTTDTYPTVVSFLVLALSMVLGCGVITWSITTEEKEKKTN